MKYTIFEGKREVEINDKIVEVFEKYDGPLTDIYVEILAVGNNLDENTPQDILEKEIAASMFEELELLCTITEDMKKLLDEGILG